jgi:hypothetical protein
MRVRLTVKLAEVVNGVDLSHASEGDILDLDSRDAAMLIAGGWAELVPEPKARRRGSGRDDDRPESADV